MIGADYVAQPTFRTTLDAIGSIVQDGGIDSMDVAAAYITSGGLQDFTKENTKALGGAWKGVKKRWLTSFDYCRTEPVALDALLSLPSSVVRVYDANFCVDHGGTPRIPFHPKAFFFRNTQRDYVLVGSGNLSRSGLSRGVEAGLVLGTDRVGPGDPTMAAATVVLRGWFSTEWKAATVLDGTLLARYSKVFESIPNLKNPIPTEDDVASSETRSDALSSKDLHKLRVCRNLWIETGNVTKNRGKTLPGNQLMMKRLSRVFFGFKPDPLPHNSTLGNVHVSYVEGKSHEYSLTYSDNGMDKLVLPMPGSVGPSTYDNQCLLFRRMEPGVFRLTLATKAERGLWLKKSQIVDGSFKMSSGNRQWGVF